MEEILDIVNEQDEVVGSDARSNVHRNGLLHREVDIWIFNENKEVVLQKRSETKEQYPGLWFYSVAGHVSSGDTYLESAIREAQEEIGKNILENDLIFMDKIFIGPDKIENGTNNHFELIYAYRLENNNDSFMIEDGEADGLMWFNIDKLLNPDEDFKNQVVPYLFSEKSKKILEKIKNLIK